MSDSEDVPVEEPTDSGETNKIEKQKVAKDDKDKKATKPKPEKVKKEDKEKQKTEKKIDDRKPKKPIETPRHSKIDRIKNSIFLGEVIIMLLLIIAVLQSEGNSVNSITIENPIYIIFIFVFLIAIESFIIKLIKIKNFKNYDKKMFWMDDTITQMITRIIIFGILVGIFIFPVTSNTIQSLIDSLTQVNFIISVNFLFNISIILFVFLLFYISGFIFLFVYKKYKLEPEYEKNKEPSKIEDAFLISNAGLLLFHSTRRLKPDIDEEILTSMLTVIKEFVTDSFKGQEKGNLNEMAYGHLKILLEYGEYAYLAVVIVGEEQKKLRMQMKKALHMIHTTYENSFRTWDGDLSKFVGVNDILKEQIFSKFMD